jgi:hypothetical protein
LEVPLPRDPAAAKLVSGIKKSMIRAEDDIRAGANVKKSVFREQEDINDNIKSYLSRADNFAVRMSSAVKKSGIGKSMAAKG